MRFPKHLLLLISGGLCLVLLVGCGGDAPRADEFDAAMVRATGQVQAVQFRTVGEPLDVVTAHADANVLSLDEAVHLALDHSPQIQAALARVRIAAAEAKQERLLPNPILSVAVRYPEGGGSPTIEPSLMIDLVSLLNRSRRIGAADSRLRAASGEMLEVVLDVLTDVQVRYASAQALDGQVELLARRSQRVGRLLGLARSRVEAGESSRIDVLALDAERVRVDTERIEQESERRQTRIALARLIGEPSSAATWKLTGWTAPPRVQLDEKLWIDTALEHRPDLQTRRWELAAFDDDAANAGWLVWDGTEVGIDAERDGGDWAVGPAVAVPLPFFDWGQSKRAKVEAARVEARHQLVDAARGAVEDVRAALESLVAAQRALDKVQKELIPVLESRHEQTRDAYAVGTVDITTIILSEQELEEGQSRLIELQERVTAAQLRLHRAVGGPGIAATIPAPPATQPATTHETKQ